MQDLAKALPIQTANESNARKVLARAAKGLLDAKIPPLAAYRFEKSVTGKWLIVFERKHAPKQNDATYRQAAEELTPGLFGVERIVEALGSDDDRAWWAQCAKRLGNGAVDVRLAIPIPECVLAVEVVTAASGATTPTFDANGNMTTDETGKQYAYDAWLFSRL